MTVMKLDAEAIGMRLRELRGVFRTQEDVSEKTGISVPALSLYELGKRIPGGENAAKLAKAYDTTIDYIFFGQKYTKQNQE